MRPTSRLWQVCRITLFTRPNCGLCDTAKTVLQRVQAEKPFAFKEVNIVGTPEAKAWRDLYDFDVPVIHISKIEAPEEDPKRASQAVKLMHRFSADEVQDGMRQIQDG